MTDATTTDTLTDAPIGQDASAPAPSINLEPRQASNLDWYAAREAAAHRPDELPDPLWPGQILEEVKLPEPNCTAYRADKLRREAARIKDKKPARVPRDTEPCSLGCIVLWGVVLIAGMVGGFVGLHWAMDLIRRGAGL